MQPDIVCIGEPLLEFNQQPDGRYLQGFGGDTSNCAIAAARSGATAGYVTRLGADEFGEQFMALWQREGVDTSHVVRDESAPTGVYFVTHTEAGHAFSYFRKHSAASRMRPDEVPADYIRRAKILHVSGISQAISDSAADAIFSAIEVAREAGVQVSYDTNLRLKLWPLDRARAVIHAAMSMTDIALPGLDDARQLTGLDDPDAIVDFYLGLGAGAVALTLGAEGTLVATAETRCRVPSVKVEAVDATAAGDTFDGALLARLCEGAELEHAARYANAAAALSTTGYGAVAPMPTRDAVERRLAEQSNQ